MTFTKIHIENDDDIVISNLFCMIFIEFTVEMPCIWLIYTILCNCNAQIAAAYAIASANAALYI